MVGLFLLAFAATTAAHAQEPTGNKWAFLVGVSRYPKGKPLEFAVADMTGLRDALVTSLGVNPDNIVLLTDEQATYDNIKTQLPALIDRTGPGDVVIVAFSGHGSSSGAVEDEDRKSFLLPYDYAGPFGRDQFISLMDDIYKPLAKKKGLASRLVIVDACRNNPREQPPVVPGGTFRARANDILEQLGNSGSSMFELESTPRGVFAIASCSDGEFSWEDRDLGHGVFMNYMIQGIRGEAVRNRDGSLDANDLLSYARQETLARLAERKLKFKQSPYFKNNTQTFPVLGSPGQISISKYRGKDVRASSPFHESFMNDVRKFTMARFDLTGATLNGLDMSKIDMTDVHLKDAKIRNVNFSGCNLSDADLSGADATGANFHNAILINADATGANLSSANFTGAQQDNFTRDGARTDNARGLR
jgi:hypothetical protein